MFDAAKSRADALADQIKAALNELGETLSEEEEHVERADRGAADCGDWHPPSRSAIAIGFMLRRH